MKFTALLAAALIASAATPALADGTYTGTVTGGFIDADTAGYYIAADGTPTFVDNFATADYGISANLDTISWGHSTTGANPQFSYLWWIPNAAGYADIAPNTPFLLGSIQYLNGTSDPDSLIFGTKLYIDLGNGIDVKFLQIGITTTINTNVTPEHDADFIDFGDDLDLTFNTYEGAISRADIYGMIVGDPTIELTDLKISDGFGGSGFISDGQPPVPEPATWAMMIGGFALAGATLRRGRIGVAFA